MPRSSTIQDWAGRIARVWTAVDVVEASGPEDAALSGARGAVLRFVAGGRIFVAKIDGRIVCLGGRQPDFHCRRGGPGV